LAISRTRIACSSRWPESVSTRQRRGSITSVISLTPSIPLSRGERGKILARAPSPSPPGRGVGVRDDLRALPREKLGGRGTRWLVSNGCSRPRPPSVNPEGRCRWPPMRDHESPSALPGASILPPAPPRLLGDSGPRAGRPPHYPATAVRSTRMGASSVARRRRLSAAQSSAKSCATRSVPRIRARHPPWRRRIRCASFRSTLGRVAR
jgi:hypothetical protein